MFPKGSYPLAGSDGPPRDPESLQASRLQPPLGAEISLRKKFAGPREIIDQAVLLQKRRENVHRDIPPVLLDVVEELLPDEDVEGVGEHADDVGGGLVEGSGIPGRQDENLLRAVVGGDRKGGLGGNRAVDQGAPGRFTGG